MSDEAQQLIANVEWHEASSGVSVMREPGNAVESRESAWSDPIKRSQQFCQSRMMGTACILGNRFPVVCYAHLLPVSITVMAAATLIVPRSANSVMLA